MFFVIKTTVIVIGCLSAAKTEKCAPGDWDKPKTPLSKEQYPENAPPRELRRSGFAENENSLEMPENDIRKLLRIKALPSLNTALTKENCCATFRSPSDIKLYHKEVNATAILNKIFYKFGGRCAGPGSNDGNNNSRSIVVAKRKMTNLMNSRNSTPPSGNFLKQSLRVGCTISINFLETRNARNGSKSDKNAVPSRKPRELQASGRRGRKIRFSGVSGVSATRNLDLEFPDVPAGDVMRVPDLKLEKEHFLFGPFSELMGYLQPSSFPIGFVKDALKSHAPVRILILKALKIEAPVIGWISAWLHLALALPCALAARFCCATNGMQRLLNEDSSNFSDDLSNKWTRISLAIVMHLLLLSLLSCAVLMLVTNKQLSKSSTVVPNATDVVLKDVETFVENTQLQISTVSSSSVRIAVDAAHQNLEGAEELLGKPLQSALDAETGLGTAMQALVDLTGATAMLSSRVSDLLKDCHEARKVEKGLQRSLAELSRLLTVARQECLPRDQALCDTLQTSGLNVSLGVDQLSSETNLQQLQVFGGTDEFNKTVEKARRAFQALPRRISLETAVSRAELQSSLNSHRSRLYDAVRSLEDLSKSITGKLSSARNSILEVFQRVAAKDLWRWLAVLGLSLLTFFVWGLWMCGASCGCGPTPKTIPFLLTGLGLTCALSPILWAFGTVAFMLGGHGETFICQPLYDHPKYTVLGDLLNPGGILYEGEGLFNHVLKGNASLRVDAVLRNCQNNHPTYTAFNLQNIINISLLANFNEWQDLKTLFRKFSVDLSSLQILTPSLEHHLQQLSAACRVNLTDYRSELSGLITSKDLNSLAEQLESVAKQLSVSEDAQNMEKLAHKTRKIISGEVQPLKELRDGILYKMAAVEVLIVPLGKQVNQSLRHMKAVQDFIERNGFEIAQKVVDNYLAELENYLLQMYKYVARKITQDIGKCRPLWDAFDAARIIICKMTVDPMNGFSFACFLCVLLFLGLAPVIIRTVGQYKETTEDTFSSITHRRARNGLLIDDEGTWATPSPPSSSEEAARLREPWTTPRPPELIVPPEAQPISRAAEPQAPTKTSRILDPARLIHPASRTQEQPRTIRSPTPRDRQEALRVVERIDRRTPRSWL